MSFVNQRLQDITGNRGIPFGGLHVILVGDLYQLSPVCDSFAFLDPNITRWDEFSMFELREIMRQKDDKDFSMLLNRLRTTSGT